MYSNPDVPTAPVKQILASINPLAFLEVDEPTAPGVNPPPDFESVVRYLCAPETDADLGAVLDRYRQISTEPTQLFAVPADKNVLTKLVWPLRNAKGCYMFGNYLGTISLCGMVSEMVGIVLFRMSNVTINNKPIDEPTERFLFSDTFEKLGQDRRVRVLAGWSLIDDEMKSWFETVKLIRKKYLHLYSQEHDEIAPDAVRAFHATIRLVTKVIGQGTHDGMMVFNPAFIRYLERTGTIGVQTETLEETSE